MTRDELLRRATARLEEMSEEHLFVADHFLAYLEECGEEDATEELLRIPGFVEAFEKGCREAEEGKLTHFDDIRWDE